MKVTVRFPNRNTREYSFEELNVGDKNVLTVGTEIDVTGRKPKHMIKNIIVGRDGSVEIEVY
ncbi:hypothetical protein [Bacillus cereus]|uniref:hypothetical protein n=1 Tax=Bacillus cereus TaxID=1396 RepID=UPI000BFC6B6C|nr:hypothetical protein [Bacillus cereus]PGR83535.1 hypothetical protein COC63_05995 [Bacillus cereus]